MLANSGDAGSGAGRGVGCYESQVAIFLAEELSNICALTDPQFPPLKEGDDNNRNFPTPGKVDWMITCTLYNCAVHQQESFCFPSPGRICFLVYKGCSLALERGD